MDAQGWVPISIIADFKRVCFAKTSIVSPLNNGNYYFEHWYNHETLILPNFLIQTIIVFCFCFFVKNYYQVKRMSTDIPFILDALQKSSAVEVQVTSLYFSFPTPLISFVLHNFFPLFPVWLSVKCFTYLWRKERPYNRIMKRCIQ